MGLNAYSNCTPLTTGCFLYQDSGLTTPVANGVYSDGTNTFTVTGGAGEITSQGTCPVTTTTTTTTTTLAPTTTTTTTTTTLAPTTTTTTTTTTLPVVAFDLGYAVTNGSDACQNAITSPTFYFAAFGSTFTAGTILYTDSGLTTLAPDDYYSDGTTWYLIIGGNGTLTGGTPCSGTTTTTTTTTQAPTTTTTTTTTTNAVSCNNYNVGGSPSISIEWFDCGGSFFTQTVGAGGITICAETGTVVQTGGSGSITDLGSC
jgi:hypothetical protein